MSSNIQQPAERFESAFFTLFRKLGPELGLPPGVQLTGPQVMMLYSLSKMAPCSAGKLAQKMEVTPAAITIMIERLVQQDYVVRQADASDRRVVLLELTEQGRDALRQMRELRSQAITGYLSYLAPEELESFLAAFEKIASRIEEQKGVSGDA